MEIVKKIIAKQNNIVQEKPITIVCLGDSVTQGCFECYLDRDMVMHTVFDYENAYSTKLKKMLNLLYPSVQFNIINSGISGDCATGGLERLERDVLQYKPDLVVVGFALNDSTRGLEALNEYCDTMEQILQKIQEFGAECIVLTPNMMNTGVGRLVNDEISLNVANTCGAVQNDGTLDKYVEGLKAVAAKKNVKVCDIYAQWKNMYAAGVNITELLANKFNHPPRELHGLIAMMLLQSILEM